MFRTALAIIVLGAAGLAGAASADPGAGSITAGTGCSVQCIQKALVTPTASGGTVQVTTSVAASVTVSVTKLEAIATQLAAPGVHKHVSVPSFAKQHTVVLTGLQPETTYRIVVGATDLQGKKASRVGTFATLKVQTAMPDGPGTFDSGLGCRADCIEKAIVSQSRTAPRTATVDLRTAVPARLRVRVMRGLNVIDEATSSGLKTTWSPTVGGLMPGTTYDVAVYATDAQGNVDDRWGTFSTVDAIVRVTIAKLHVIDDSEKGGNAGEIEFGYWVNGIGAGGGARRDIDSGTILGAPVWGTSRPGATFAFSVGADARIVLAVNANECDRSMQKNCTQEATVGNPWDGESVPLPGGGNGKKEQWARAVGVFNLADLLEPDGVPGWYGTGVTPPAGHDAYMFFQTTSHRLKFRVLAYVDIEYQFDD